MSDNHEINSSSIQIFSKEYLFSKAPTYGLPVVVVVILLAYFFSGSKMSASENTPEAVAARIQKVGSVQIKDANRVARSGEDVFKAQCSACHSVGAAGAPKFGDASAWGPRIAKGYEALLNSALKGKGAMGAQGGGEFEDFEIGRGVVYMANAGGAKFSEPKKPEAK